MPWRCGGKSPDARRQRALHNQRGLRGWQVQRAAYFYAIGLHDSGELLAYHWHPRGKSPVVDPHLHIRANIQLGERWLGKVHLPTGAIKLEDIVSLAVNELAVEPLREDWELLLNENRT